MAILAMQERTPRCPWHAVGASGRWLDASSGGGIYPDLIGTPPREGHAMGTRSRAPCKAGVRPALLRPGDTLPHIGNRLFCARR